MRPQLRQRSRASRARRARWELKWWRRLQALLDIERQKGLTSPARPFCFWAMETQGPCCTRNRKWANQGTSERSKSTAVSSPGDDDQMGIERGMNAKRPPRTRKALFASSSASFGDATERARQPLPRLLRRGWREPFALAARLWFRFGLRRLLNFLLAFVFASHASSVTQKGRSGKDKTTGRDRFPFCRWSALWIRASSRAFAHGVLNSEDAVSAFVTSPAMSSWTHSRSP
jgi:hypothetical protein